MPALLCCLDLAGGDERTVLDSPAEHASPARTACDDDEGERVLAGEKSGKMDGRQRRANL